MAKTSAAVFDDADLEDLIEQFLAYEGPDPRQQAWTYGFLKRYFAPSLLGAENIPDKPTLFIGNHAMLGLDGMLILPLLYQKTGRVLRAMADNAWFQTITRNSMARNGLVLAHPKVCSALMNAGEDLLVFPGGAAEATKSANKKYSLVWRERYGFVRMAALHGYDITPFGLVGPDDWFDHVIEGEGIMDTPVGSVVKRLGLDQHLREDLIPPLPAGLFASLMPKPQRCYMAIGKAIEVPDLRGKQRVPMSVQKAVREETAASVEQLVADMLLLRAQGKQQESWLRRMLTR